MNAIKDAFLNSNIDTEAVLPQPLPDPQNNIDEDLDDIEVIPVRPTKPTTRPSSPATTQSTTQIVNMDEMEQQKVVCYYTNWAWYR